MLLVLIGMTLFLLRHFVIIQIRCVFDDLMIIKENFAYFFMKPMLWVLIRTALPRQLL